MRFRTTRGRIEHYFRPIDGSQDSDQTPHPTVTFCDLPIGILRSIFEYTGRLTWDGVVDMNVSGQEAAYCRAGRTFYPEYDQEDLYPTPCFFRGKAAHFVYGNISPKFYRAETSPTDLFLLSHKLTEVAREVLYGSNEFVVRRSGPNGFAPFLRLGPQNIASLTSLHIHLDVPVPFSPCECTCECCYPKCWSKPLAHFCDGRKCICTSELLREWKRLCLYLKSILVPKRLKLFLDCEVMTSKSLKIDYDLAEEVLGPLYSLPTLAECSIRLSSTRDTRLKDLARQAVNTLTGHVFSPFPFDQLPSELRYHVLRQTDLVVPYPLIWNCQLTSWCRSRRRSLSYSKFCSWREWGKLYAEERTRANAFGVEGHYAFPYPSPGCAHCAERDGTGFASECKLWHPPVELYQVNHAVSELARKVFLSNNRFVQLLNPSFFRYYNHHPDRVADYVGPAGGALDMLQLFKPRDWQHLRNIEIVIPVADSHYLSEPYTKKTWEQTLDLLSYGKDDGYFMLSRLKLHVVVAFYLGEHINLRASPSVLQDTCRRIASALSRLQQLLSFTTTVLFPAHDRISAPKWTVNTLDNDELEAYMEQIVLDERYQILPDRAHRREEWKREMYYPHIWWWSGYPHGQEYDYE